MSQICVKRFNIFNNLHPNDLYHDFKIDGINTRCSINTLIKILGIEYEDGIDDQLLCEYGYDVVYERDK